MQPASELKQFPTSLNVDSKKIQKLNNLENKCTHTYIWTCLYLSEYHGWVCVATRTTAFRSPFCWSTQFLYVCRLLFLYHYIMTILCNVNEGVVMKMLCIQQPVSKSCQSSLIFNELHVTRIMIIFITKYIPITVTSKLIKCPCNRLSNLILNFRDSL